MRIYLSRHGETNWNVEGLVAGRTNIPQLTLKGIKHAQSVATAYKSHNIEVIFSSPLNRALDTAYELANTKKLPITIDDRLIEMDFGLVNGKKSDESNIHWARRAVDLNYKFPGGGECYNDVLIRLTSFYDDLKSKNPNSAFLFGHAGSGRGLVALGSNQDLTNPRNLTSIIQPNSVVYEIDTDSYSVEWFNTETHERGQGILRRQD